MADASAEPSGAGEKRRSFVEEYSRYLRWRSVRSRSVNVLAALGGCFWIALRPWARALAWLLPPFNSAFAVLSALAGVALVMERRSYRRSQRHVRSGGPA